MDFVVCPVLSLGLEAWGHLKALLGVIYPGHLEQWFSEFNQESPDLKVQTQ